ncbi:hypothetical protein HNP33_003100 [Comamonas odontotermitis]|uniref:Uncharacterized protein n=1 Tax=Comamonas odontotermitis TaxID=379895 RepID=A0ABR6RIJ1_9BURK|nr:hypothetical protein [Comamonas odontotermitis]MBB6578995.1 hypothetical protein [Comamonas odontotermitis]
MNIKFSGTGMAFLSHYMATQDIRYYLNGIFLQPLTARQGGGVIGVATNGKALGLWHDQAGEADREIIIRVTKPLISSLGKFDKGLPRSLRVVDGRLICMSAEEEEIYIQPNPHAPVTGARMPWEVEGKFPDFTRVVKRADKFKDAQGPVDAIDARYLELLNKSVVGTTRFPNGVQLRQPAPLGEIYARFCAKDEAFAVVMPLSWGEIDIPKWLHQIFKAAEAKE